jgi:hypothetical protein
MQERSRLRKALLLVLAALGLMAMAAPSAMAEVISAKWGQKTSSLRISGTLQVEDEWYENKVSCSGESAPLVSEAAPGGSNFKAYTKNNNYYGVPIKVMTFNCGSATLELPLSPYTWSGFPGVAKYDTVTEGYFLGNSGFSTSAPAFTSGLGGFSPRYYSVPLSVEFRNAGTEIVEVENEYEEMEEVEVEFKDSRLIFSDTKIGEAELRGDIYATGTLTVDDGKGNPRTLSH